MNKVTSPRVRILLALLIIFQLTATAFSGISFVAGQGVVLTGADGVVLTGADGVVLTGADGVVLTGADGVVLTGADGVVLTGADGVVLTGADGVVLTGADVNTFTRPYGVVLTGADSVGIKSLDAELALMMNRLPDTSAINVVVVYHRMPTTADFNALRAVGILGGLKFRTLPMVMVNATKRQIAAISTRDSIRSIYSNKTLEFLTHDTRVVTGQDQVVADNVLSRRNGGLPVSGQGVTVAVLDTGIDALHPDLPFGSKVVQNTKVLDLMGLPLLGFIYPVSVEGLVNTDLVMGHGTFVAGVVAGTGAASGGYYGGMAPGAKILGVSCGEASLFYVLSGMDYILSNRVARNIRVVNCSFGVSGIFDANDPVNIASKIMHDAGISVVFSAGNRGNQPNSLNPYSVADWVIGVGSATKAGSLSSFSSRGQASYGIFHPTLIAPGEAIVSARAVGVNVVGTAGLAGLDASGLNDLQAIPPSYLLRYTLSSGTSFAAPHVAGTIAMMLQTNPQLTPDQIKLILQETATPMLGYSRYEVGAGHLNTYAAVRKAAFNTSFGQFRALLNNSSVTLTREALSQFSGELAPGASYSTQIEMPQDTVFATLQAGWVRRGGIVNSLNVSLQRHGQSYQSNPATVLLGGNQMRKTGIIVNEPAVGDWTITVTNTSNTLTGGAQMFICSVEIIRANYGDCSNINQLPEGQQLALKRALRSGLINAGSGDFVNSQTSRIEVARALALGGGARVPVYLPYSPTFADLPADGSAVFVESLARLQGGDLLGATGTQFHPNSTADRLAVAVAAVKMLGLQQEAQSSTLAVGEVTDRDAIPEEMRGFVAVAIRRNLMGLDETGSFRPFAPIRRGELAQTGVALQQATR
ncbi:MAG TPA: S8 family serine peptidase [Blastocatellia bacterium]|nr:S8 family serine peptidase [Blastocatellia bacterium]